MESIDGGGGKKRLKKRFENGSLASVISSANGTEGVKTSDV